MELRKNVYKKIDLKKKSTSKLTHIHLRKHEKRDFYQDLVNNLYIIYLRFYDNKTSVSIKSLVLFCITFPQCLSLSFVLCPLKHLTECVSFNKKFSSVMYYIPTAYPCLL